MDSSPRRPSSFAALRHDRVALRATLFLSGIALLIFSSTFLLSADASVVPARSSAEGANPAEAPDARATGGSTVPVGDAIDPTPVPTPNRSGTPAPPASEADAPDPATLFGIGGSAPIQTAQPEGDSEAPQLTPRPTATSRPAVPTATARPPTPRPPAPTPIPPTATPRPPTPQPGCPQAFMSGFALDLFTATNNERVNAGLAPLVAAPCVVFVAQLRSDDMAARGYFSHDSPEGQNAFTLMTQYNVPYGWAGENIARNNYPDAESVGVAIHDLMQSAGHRENILRPQFQRLGIGFADDGNGMKYYTMIFTGPPY